MRTNEERKKKRKKREARKYYGLVWRSLLNTLLYDNDDDVDGDVDASRALN